MLKNILIALLLVVSQASFAKGSSHVSDSTSGQGFIPIEDAQRVMHFTPDRQWFTIDGIVLVCNYDAEISFGGKECTPRGQLNGNAWVPLLSLSVQGYAISGIQYIPSSGGKQLFVFWRKATK